MAHWTFFTNHSHILFLVALNPEISVREMSDKVGITERAVLKILSDLSKDGFISVTKKGRCNTYKIDADKKLRHEIEGNCKVKDIIKTIKATQAKKSK